MKHEKSAGAVIFYIDKEPVFLFLKYTRYWGFARGWIEAGESEEKAAIREVKEETSLNVKLIPGFKYDQRWFFRFNGEIISKEALFFLAEVSKEEASKVKISDEHEDFAWKNYEDALKIMKIKQNKEMLKKAYEFIKEYRKQRKLI